MNINLKLTIMKKILKLGLLMVFAITTLSSYATNGDFLLNVKKGNGKLIGFSINGIQKINVSIYDKDRNLIYSENATGKEGIMKTYSLEEFPEGTYYLVVSNGFKKVRYEITVNDEMAQISKDSMAVTYKNTANKNQSLANVN